MAKLKPGTVGRSYNTDFQVDELSVNAGPITFGYDADTQPNAMGRTTLVRRHKILNLRMNQGL